VFRTCSASDPAIDEAASNMDGFYEDHDIRHLVIKPGETPTWVDLVAMPRDELSAIWQETQSTNQQAQAHQLYGEIFRVGCAGFENLSMISVAPDGTETEVPLHFVQEMLPGRCRRLPDAIVRAFGSEAVEEFAGVILQISRLGDREKKASSQPTCSTTSSGTSSTATTANTDQE